MDKTEYTNLLMETYKSVSQEGKRIQDAWIIIHGRMMPWRDFVKEAAASYYYQGYGGAEVAMDLKLVYDDCVFVRGEYDGSEWWECVYLKPTSDERYCGGFKQDDMSYIASKEKVQAVCDRAFRPGHEPELVESLAESLLKG